MVEGGSRTGPRVAALLLLLLIAVHSSWQQKCSDYKVIRQDGSYVDPATKQFLNCWGNGVQSGESEIVVLIDTSGSMGTYGFNAAKDFVTSLLSEIRIAFNATRIAVGTFSTKHRINFNYILNPSFANHKCKFVEDFKNKVTFDAEGTDIRGALNDAYTVFSTLINDPITNLYRAQSNKAVLFLSDGYGNVYNGNWDWKNGKDPTPEVNLLKRTGFVEVYAMAMTSRSDQHTLQNVIATDPSLYLYKPTFQQIQDLAKKIRGDAYEKDYETFSVSMTFCGECDASAKCGCNLRSGKYRCICPKGYFGTAEKASTRTCTVCPINTYGGIEGLDVCTPCPAHSGTKGGTTRTRVSDCYCDDGYLGNPATSTPCTPRPCSAPIAITNGFISNPSVCSSAKAVFGVACNYQCNPKYELAGVNSILTCGSTGTWIGSTPSCQLIHCPGSFAVDTTEYSASCTNAIDSAKVAYPIDTTCTFTCKSGYYKYGGSTSISCTDTKSFDGSIIQCKEILCPLVPKTHKFLKAKFAATDCMARNLKVGERCEFACSNQYNLKGVSVVACNEQSKTNPTGKWSTDISSTPPSCEDVTPPDFGSSNANCSQGYIIKSTTLPGMSYGWVNFTALVPTDNSEDEPVVTSSVGDYELGKSYKVNFTLAPVDVTFTAIDEAKNTRVCRFKFEVKDEEIPEVVFCPENQLINKSGEQVVIWDPPVFRDNCGPYPQCLLSTTSTISSGTTFQEGISSPVTYTCTDPSGNKQETCSFTVLVQAPTCAFLQPPRNGALASFGTITMAQCQSTYYPVSNFPFFYACKNGAWTATGPAAPETFFPVPDCTLRAPPTGLTQGFEFFFWYTGDCNQEATKVIIKQKFIALNLCNDPACSPDTIDVHCGAVGAVRRRRRDNTQSLAIKLGVKTRKIDPASVSDPTTAQTQLKNEMKNTLAPNVIANGNTLDPATALEPNLVQRSQAHVDGAPQEVCASDNDMLEGNGPPIAPTLKCATCAAGQFMNVTTKMCEKCPPGTFQPHAGKTECLTCPDGTTSVLNDVQNFTSCKKICDPGEFSLNGLAPCNKCSFGMYSIASRSTSCSTCPVGTTTVVAGAKSQFECGSKCQPGSYSDTGVEPCLPCPKGKYQNSQGQLTCANCGGVSSTYGEGSKSVSDCVDINECDSNPCLNDGHCIGLKDNFRCECTSGFWGRKCEKEVNECALDPCVNGGTCVDKFQSYKCVCKPGTSGTRCDTLQGICTGSTCSGHGTCKDLANNEFKCDCSAGYQGTFCEARINLCEGEPCLNEGHCSMSGLQSSTCSCKTGYSGPLCNVKSNFCENDPCHNGAQCNDLAHGYTCTCAPGYEGVTCGTQIDMCLHTPCKNGGTCTNLVNDVSCNCAASYGGKFCDTKLSNDYDLALTSRLAASYSSLKGRQDMSSVTLALWIRTYDIHNFGTPISYAVQIPGGRLQDNALVLADYRSFDFTVNNVTAPIDITANDGTWHHVAITWQGSTGNWVSYKDGVEATRSSTPLQKGQVIRGNGLFVLGEEQDELGAGFTPSESFFGDISQLNIWSTVLSANDIYDLATSPLAREGDVVAWSDFSAVQHGRTLKRSPSVVANFASSLREFGVIRDHTLPSSLMANTRTSELSASNAIQCSDKCDSTAFREWCRAFVFHRPASKCHFYGTSLLMRQGEEVLDLDRDLFQMSCVKELGMTLRTIPNSAISASSAQSGKDAFNARLYNTPKADEATYWQPQSASGSWIEVNLGKAMRISAIATQGHPDLDVQQYVTKYTVQYKSSASSSWQAYKHASGGSTVSFTGNSNPSGVVRNEMYFVATHVRVYPTAWAAAGIALRLELYGCTDAPQGVPATKSDANQCSPSPCLNGGVCVDLYTKYQCSCKNGYTGTRCETYGGCPLPNIPTHGKVAALTVHQVTYASLAGFSMQGSATMSCSNGAWSGSVPSCIDTDECTLSKCSHGCFNSVGSYTCYCPRGYNLGSDKKTCQDVNECSTANGDCDHICTNKQGGHTCSCRSGFQLVQGKSCTDIDECAGSSHGCQQSCKNLPGSYTCECSFGYILAANKKSCTANPCAALSNINHGSVAVSGQTAVYKCETNFRVDGIATRHCQQDGQWSGVEPKCKHVQCVPLLAQNVQMTVNGNSMGSTAQFSCQPSYLLIGTNKQVCQVSGEWSGIYPTCIYSTCAPLPNPLHGTVLGRGVQLGSAVRTECDQGYRLVQTNLEFRTCSGNGQWTGGNSATVTCQLVDCGNPPSIGSGSVTLQGATKYMARAKYTCSQAGGQRCLEGPATRICEANGQWSGQQPSCQASSCCTPPLPKNSTLHSDGIYPYNARVYIQCHTGFTTGGTEYRTCQSTGQYSGTPTTCTIVDCGSPGTVSNGIRFGDETVYQSKARFFCNPGFKLTGSSERTCQADGKWTGTTPSCASSSCGKVIKGISGELGTTDGSGNCHWLIQVTQGQKVSIEFPRFELAGEDSVSVYDGQSYDSFVTFKFGSKPRPVTGNSHFLRITYKGHGNGGKGFQLKFRQSVCGGMISSLNGVITSPGFPIKYYPNLDCYWTIHRPYDKIKLAFRDFTLVQSIQDYTDIRAGPFEGTAIVLYQRFGVTTPILNGDYSDRWVWVHFHSDNQYEAKGFYLLHSQFIPRKIQIF